jgi:hypothetical protein
MKELVFNSSPKIKVLPETKRRRGREEKKRMEESWWEPDLYSKK